MMLGAIFGILFGLYAILAVINVVGVIIGTVIYGAGSLIGEIFSGVFSLSEGGFFGESLVLGIALGLIWYFLRKRNAAVRREL